MYSNITEIQYIYLRNYHDPRDKTPVAVHISLQ